MSEVTQTRWSIRRWLPAGLAVGVLALMMSCAPTMEAIDRRIERTMRDRGDSVIPGTPVPTVSDPRSLREYAAANPRRSMYDKQPTTVNPSST